MRMKRTGRYIIPVALVLIFSTIPLGAAAINSILINAEEQVGAPYRTGGVLPGGFDCSGFVSWLYSPHLPDLPRISRDQANQGSLVTSGNWQPGDLLFYATGTDPNRINHVAIWYGNGTIIHSISDGPETGVVMTPASSRYWRQRYVTARRVLPENPVNPLLSDDTSQNDSSSQMAPTQQIPDDEDSPWDDFDGVLRGDFDSWLLNEQDAFEAYKNENG